MISFFGTLEQSEAWFRLLIITCTSAELIWNFGHFLHKHLPLLTCLTESKYKSLLSYYIHFHVFSLIAWITPLQEKKILILESSSSSSSSDLPHTDKSTCAQTWKLKLQHSITTLWNKWIILATARKHIKSHHQARLSWLKTPFYTSTGCSHLVFLTSHKTDFQSCPFSRCRAKLARVDRSP